MQKDFPLMLSCVALAGDIDALLKEIPPKMQRMRMPEYWEGVTERCSLLTARKDAILIDLHVLDSSRSKDPTHTNE